MSLPDGQLGSALSSPVETGRPLLLQQRTPPERVSPPRQDVTPYTAAKDHVRRLERSVARGRARAGPGPVDRPHVPYAVGKAS